MSFSRVRVTDGRIPRAPWIPVARGRWLSGLLPGKAGGIDLRPCDRGGTLRRAGTRTPAAASPSVSQRTERAAPHQRSSEVRARLAYSAGGCDRGSCYLAPVLLAPARACPAHASGGFAQNREMRERYHRHPITTEWTSAPPSDTGDAIRAAQAIGAALALMDDAWWGPTAIMPNGRPLFVLWERSFPFSIIVDSSGQRFMNESASYVDCGHWQYERHRTIPAIPAWLIIDSKHRRFYPFGFVPPMITRGR